MSVDDFLDDPENELLIGAMCLNEAISLASKRGWWLLETIMKQDDEQCLSEIQAQAQRINAALNMMGRLEEILNKLPCTGPPDKRQRILDHLNWSRGYLKIAARACRAAAEVLQIDVRIDPAEAAGQEKERQADELLRNLGRPRCLAISWTRLWDAGLALTPMLAALSE